MKQRHCGSGHSLEDGDHRQAPLAEMEDVRVVLPAASAFG